MSFSFSDFLSQQPSNSPSREEERPAGDFSFSSFLGTEQASRAAPTFDTARRDPELLGRIRSYYGNIRNKTFETDDEAFNYFTRDRTFADNNLLYMGKEVANAATLEEPGRDDLRYLREYWDRLPNMGAEGGRGLASGLYETGRAMLMDPATYITMGVGRALAQPAARVASSAATRAALGSTVSKALASDVGSNLVGQSIADLSANATANALTQTALMSLDMQDEYSPGQTAVAGAIGAAAGPAIYGAFRGVGAAGRALYNATSTNVEPPHYAYLSDAEKAVMQRVDDFITPMGEAQVQRNYRVFDADGNEVGRFDSLREARANAPNDALVQVFEGNQPTGFGSGISNAVRSYTNRIVDGLLGTEKLTQLGRRLSDETDEAALDLKDPHMWAVNAGQNAQATSSLTTAIEGGMQFRIADGMIEPIRGSKGLGEILEPLASQPGGPQEVNQLGAYMFAKRLQDIEAGTGRASPIDLGLSDANRQYLRDLVQTVENNPGVMSRWQPVIDDIQKFNNNFLDFMVDSGVLSQEQRDKVSKANTLYLPIHRLLSPEAGERGATGTSAVDRTRRYVRGVTGATAEIEPENRVDLRFLNPLAAYRQNVERAMELGIRNVYLQRMANTVNRLPQGVRSVFGEVIPMEASPTTVSYDTLRGTLARTLDDNRVDGTLYDTIMMGLDEAKDAAPDALNMIRLFTMTRPDGENIIPFYQDGQQRFLRVDNPDLLASATIFDRAITNERTSNLLFRVLGEASQTFQHIITRDPEFVFFTSLPTDTLSASIYSRGVRSGAGNVSDYVPGAGVTSAGAIERGVRGANALASGDRYDMGKAIANGVVFGGMASMTRQDSGLVGRVLQSAQLEQEATFGLSAAQDRRAAQRVGLAISRALGKTNSALSRISEGVESAPRLGEYEIQRGIYGDTARAAYETTQGNINFRNRGADRDIQDFFRTVPFLRAANNVWYRMMRGRDFSRGDYFEGYSEGQSRQAENARSGLRAVMTVGIPLLAYAAYSLDDERYMSLREEERNRFFHFWVGDTHVKIRKTDDVAQLYNSIERIMVGMREGDRDTYDVIRASLLSLGTEQLPGGLRAGTDPVDALTNYLPFGLRTVTNHLLNNSFGSSPIIPRSLENERAEGQFDEGRTSELARQLASAIPGASPIMMEYYARDLTGPLWKYSNDFYNAVQGITGGEGVARGTADAPMIRRFVADVMADMRSHNAPQKFRELLDEAVAADSARRNAESRGRTDLSQARLPAYNARMGVLVDALPRLRETEGRLQRIRQDLRRAYNLPEDQVMQTARERGYNPSNPRQARTLLVDGYMLDMNMEQYTVVKALEARLREARY